jgi:hypothetical protein
MKYEFVHLDVWGNEEDGFEVNDQHASGTIIDIENIDNDQEILEKCIEEGWLKPGVTLNDVTIDGSDEYDLNIDEASNGRMLFTLRLVDEPEVASAPAEQTASLRHGDRIAGYSSILKKQVAGIAVRREASDIWLVKTASATIPMFESEMKKTVLKYAINEDEVQDVKLLTKVLEHEVEEMTGDEKTEVMARISEFKMRLAKLEYLNITENPSYFGASRTADLGMPTPSMGGAPEAVADAGGDGMEISADLFKNAEQIEEEKRFKGDEKSHSVMDGVKGGGGSEQGSQSNAPFVGGSKRKAEFGDEFGDEADPIYVGDDVEITGNGPNAGKTGTMVGMANGLYLIDCGVDGLGHFDVKDLIKISSKRKAGRFTGTPELPTKQCEKCGGTGEIVIKNDDEEDPTSVFHDRPETDTCPDCNGRGTIYVMDFGDDEVDASRRSAADTDDAGNIFGHEGEVICPTCQGDRGYGSDDMCSTCKGTGWVKKTAMKRKAGSEDAFNSHVLSCEQCGKAMMAFDPDALCPTGQQFWKEQIEGMGGEVTDPAYGKTGMKRKAEPMSTQLGPDLIVTDSVGEPIEESDYVSNIETNEDGIVMETGEGQAFVQYNSGQVEWTDAVQLIKTGHKKIADMDIKPGDKLMYRGPACGDIPVTAVEAPDMATNTIMVFFGEFADGERDRVPLDSIEKV